MATTTIRIEEELKARVAEAASRAGKTTHAFVLDAIAQAVEQTELDDAFHRLADERWANLLTTGESVPWADAKKYLVAREQGKPVKKPKARKLER